MKKILFRFFLSIFFIGITTACTHEDKYAEEYIEACAKNDFATARMIIDKMKVDSDDGKKYKMEKHESYVNKKELLYLVSQNDEQSSNRLWFLFQEMGNSSIKLFLDQGTEEEAKKANINDELNIAKWKIASIAVASENTHLLNKILGDNIDLLKNDKVRSYLKNENEEAYNRYMKELKGKLFSDLPTDVRPIVPAQVFTYTNDRGDRKYDECRSYNEEAYELNERCLELIEYAIETGDGTLAVNVYKKMRKTIVYDETTIKHDYYNEKLKKRVGGKWRVKITHQRNDINKAKDIILKAQNSKQISRIRL